MRVFSGRRGGRLALGVVMALALSAGLAYAKSRSAAETIHACVARDAGTVRLIQPGHAGPAGPAGQQGRAGDTGARGPAGADGVSGYLVTSTGGTVDDGVAVHLSYTCPSGEVPVSGGFDVTPVALGVTTMYSGVTPDKTGWDSAILDQSGQTLNRTYGVVCIGAPSTSASAAARGSASTRGHFTQTRLSQDD